MKTYSHRINGFTLIELLVYMGLLGIFLVTITTVFTSILSARLATTSYGSIANDSRYLIRRIGYDAQRATSIASPAFYGASQSSFIITVPEGTVTYSLVGNNLVFQRGSNTYTLNGDSVKVQAFEVTRTKKGTHDALNIHLVLESLVKTEGNIKTRTFDLVYGIR